MAPMFGSFALIFAFVATLISVGCLIVGTILKGELKSTFSWSGRLAAILGFVGLTACCCVLLFCFLSGDYSIQYVLNEKTNSDNLLLKISGLWAGRQGSLLFWAWLISLFSTIVASRRMGKGEALDTVATLISQIILLAFVGILLFSDSNMPFVSTSAAYYTSDGYLNAKGLALGMNALLEHWAMAVHPPTLFVGYAGLTIPFAYAIAAVITGDASDLWVQRCERYALVSWLFLTIGIGLGAVWAYVCLGWGGYWGWDPVENASLLPWLICVALIHSFSQYKHRGQFKLWTVLCASLAFASCILGTFISRSGLVQSVHAFEGDLVSLVLFGTLIVASMAAGIIGCLVRRKSFASDASKSMTSLVSRDGAFYLNNLIMVLMAALLSYLTIAQALPTWLPLGGTSISAGTYDAIARPIGILYLLLLAACPLLAWGKTDPKSFWKKARIPALCAAVLFVCLVIYAVVALIPAYDATILAGGTQASELASCGPAFYYHGLALVGFAVASLLLFNSLFRLIRALGTKGKSIASMLPHIGSSVGHLAMAFILVGLIGSNMYITEKSGYVNYDPDTDQASEPFEIGDYSLVFSESDVTADSSNTSYEYCVAFDVYRDDEKLGTISPSVTYVTTTEQRKYNAGVLSLPTEDVFVVYQGIRNSDNALSIDARVNPLVSLVWIGFGLLCIGILLSTIGRREKVGRNMSEKPIGQSI